MLLMRSQFYNISMYLLILVIGVIYAIPAYKSPQGAYRAIARFCSINRWLLLKICKIKYEIRGPIPDEAALVCAKHMSFLDIVMLSDALPQFRFIIKNQLRYVPILGFYAKRVGSSPVKRGEKGKAMKQMVDDLEKSGARNGQTVIYPQGTRVLPGEVRPYKKGAAVIYQNFGLPAYMAATNVGVLWARRSAYRYPGTAIMEFLPERIEPGLPPDEFMELISHNIETRSNELMQEYPAEI